MVGGPVRDTVADGARFDESQVPLYYSRKTSEIVYKYGPGPRIHFHVGIFDSGSRSNTSVAQSVIQRRLVESQEAALEHAGRTWGAAPGQLLDIGCGLGGGSLYWAQEHGMAVTALTVTAEHVPIVADYARQALASDLVRPVLGDIHELQEDRGYDAAAAFESSGYMDRNRLFTVVARALKLGGWFGIQEHFVCRPEYADFLDGYYKTRLGTLTEYISSAQAAGFSLENDEDITDRATEFWVQSMAWVSAELHKQEHSCTPSPIPVTRLRESALSHGKLFRLWRDHAAETRQLLFRLTRPRPV